MDETQTEPLPIKKTIKEIMKEADIQDNRIKRRRTEKTVPSDNNENDHIPPKNQLLNPHATGGPRMVYVNGKIVVDKSNLNVVVNDFNYDVPTRRRGKEKVQLTRKWDDKETKLFYKVLRQCGTDFSLMETFLPGRTRKEIKNKYRKEEKLHRELIEETLSIR